MDAHLLNRLLEDCAFGHPLHLFHTVTSTNDICKRLAEEGEPEGALILADHQSAGRGQFERAWESPCGEGLYLSLLLRPTGHPSGLPHLSLQAAHAVREALAESGVRALRVSPPNDVLVGDRKIAGLLVEPRIGNEKIEFVVLGIGVNLRQTADSWKELALRRPATSCWLEGVELSVEDAASRVLHALARRWMA